MSEVWAVAVATGGAYMSSKGQQKQAEKDREYNTQMTEEAARNNARLAKFEGELSDYYSQLNRARKQRGLDNIRQFSQLGRIAPEYQQTSQPITNPTAPDPEAVLPKKEESTPAPSKKSGGLANKLLDPLGLF